MESNYNQGWFLKARLEKWSKECKSSDGNQTENQLEFFYKLNMFFFPTK